MPNETYGHWRYFALRLYWQHGVEDSFGPGAVRVISASFPRRLALANVADA